MASDTSLGREDRPPDPAVNSSPMSRIMGSLIGTVSQSARRRFGMLREHRHPNQSEPSITPPTTAPPHETTPLNNNGIVSPSITDSAQHQNLDDSLTPPSTPVDMRSRSESPVVFIPPPQLGIPETPTRSTTGGITLFGDNTPSSSVGIDENTTQMLHWQCEIGSIHLSHFMDMDATTQLLISTKITKFADIAPTPASLFQFAEDIISYEHNIPLSASPADPRTAAIIAGSSRSPPGDADPRTDITPVSTDMIAGSSNIATRTIIDIVSTDMVAGSPNIDTRTIDRPVSRSPPGDANPRTDIDIVSTDMVASLRDIPRADPRTSSSDTVAYPRASTDSTQRADPGALSSDATTGMISTVVASASFAALSLADSRTAAVPHHTTSIIPLPIPDTSITSLSRVRSDPPELSSDTTADFSDIIQMADPTGDIASALPTTTNTLPRITEDDVPIQTLTITSEINASSSSWRIYLDDDDMMKLDDLSMKRRKDIITSVNCIANRKDLTRTLEYARMLINKVSGGSHDDASSVASSSTAPPPPTASVSFAPIVETVEEDDDDAPPGLQERARESDTSDDDDDIGSIPASDAASTLEKLVEIMTDNNKSNLKLQEQNLAIFQNAISSKQSKPIGTEFILKQMMMQKSSDFTALPKDRNPVTVAKWYDDISRRLSRTPWDIDGTSILDVHPNHDIVRSDNNYKLRTMHLATILIDILIAAGLNDAVEALESTIALNDGVLLLSTIRDYLLPTTSTDILDALRDSATCIHKSGEPPAAFFARFDHIWSRIKNLGCDSIDDLRLASLQRGFLQGAYAQHESLDYYLKKLQHNECSLKDFSDCNAFSKHITNLFTTSKVIDDGHMTPVTGQHLARQSGGTTGTTPSPPSAAAAEGLFGSSNFLTTGICTKEIATELFKNTDCPICRYPKSHAKSHHLSSCPLKKHFGFGLIDYKTENDTRKSDHDRRQAKATRIKKKDVEDELTGAATGKVPTVSTATTPNDDEKVRATAEKVVGKNGRDAKTEKEKKEAIASNLQKQAGTVRRLGMFQSGDNDGSNWVDADTTINELNNESTL